MIQRDDADSAGIVTRCVARPVAETVRSLVEHLRVRQIKVFAVIDQQAEARRMGLDLRETTLVVFGNPRAGTAVMAAVPLAALDLPLKVLVWADDTQTRLSYYAPQVIAAKHRLSEDLLPALTAIDTLMDQFFEQL